MEGGKGGKRRRWISKPKKKSKTKTKDEQGDLLG